MKKQLIILLAVVSALMVALFLASCSQPAATGGAASASADAAASASADAAASAEAEASADAAASAEAAATEAEYKGIPTSIPADHEGRTVDMCPTCHVEGSGGATPIPDNHLIDGQLDGARNQCNTCHLETPAE